MGSSTPTISPLKLVATGIYVLVWPALQFWFANLEGMRRELFPRLVKAGEEWAARKDPSVVLAVAAAGAAHWQARAQELLELRRRHGDDAASAITAMTRDLAAIAL